MAPWTALRWQKQMWTSDCTGTTQNNVSLQESKKRDKEKSGGKKTHFLFLIYHLYELLQFWANHTGCSLLSVALGTIREEEWIVSHKNMKATITPGSWMTPKHMHSFTEQPVLTWLDDNLVWNDPVKFSHWGRSCSRISHAVPLPSPPPQGTGWLEAHLYHVHHSLRWDQVTWRDLGRKKKATITVKIHHCYFQASRETKLIWNSRVFWFGFPKTFPVPVVWPNAGMKMTQVLKFFMAQTHCSW